MDILAKKFQILAGDIKKPEAPHRTCDACFSELDI